MTILKSILGQENRITVFDWIPHCPVELSERWECFVSVQSNTVGTSHTWQLIIEHLKCG